MNRFKLEEDIMSAWSTVAAADLIEDNEQARAFRIVMEMQFQKLWDTFETLIQDRQV